MMSVTRSDQERSSFALTKIKERAAQENAHEYGQLVRRLPTMILMNGFGQSMAYLSSKQKDLLLEDLAEHLLKKLPAKNSADSKGKVSTHGQRLLDNLMHHWTTREYRLAEQEALRLLTWMKMFADAFLPKDEEAGANESTR